MNEDVRLHENVSSSAHPGHETSDVGIGLIVKFIVVFALIIAVSMPLLWWMLRHFENQANKNDVDVPPIADLSRDPPGPRLQAAPAQDFAAFRKKQLDHLEGTGWVDRDQKIIHIPIQRAMELVLEEGLPKAKSTSQQNSTRDSDTGANSDQGAANGEKPVPETPPIADEVQP